MRNQLVAEIQRRNHRNEGSEELQVKLHRMEGALELLVQLSAKYALVDRDEHSKTMQWVRDARKVLRAVVQNT